MIIGNKEFKLNEKPYVMGILNVTPDSFSDGGTHNKFDDALYATEQMIKDHWIPIRLAWRKPESGQVQI